MANTSLDAGLGDGSLRCMFRPFASNTGNSIVGGYRYRGLEIPELFGTYIYTDTISGEVWFAELIGDEWISTLWDQTFNFVVSFAEDESGNLYTVSINGLIKKFILIGE